ncbi:uncharacterized protein AB675_10540 [Cyphellophora attinorum]|uniref:Methyltransferase domain-containing protein n=1 Tax=Cyphellophora attinorum TaxID=1664694 RepID=A0A0N0NMT2_9EURO|nr:uncharacterized protein AB675_10540 [Phialophora attinorum]KPI40821.1 hypothetical protein AB675_10540 [Phialophora attinorum]
MAQSAAKTPWDNPKMVKLMQFGAIITSKPAKDMIVQSGLPKKAAALDKIVVLEQACGTAPLAKLLLETNLLDDTAKSNLEITCADFAPNMVEYVKREIDRSGWKNTTAVQADGMDTKLRSSHYTHVFVEFGPFVLRDSSKGLQECHRMLKPDGMLSTATWQYVPWIDEFKPVFKNNPEFPPFADGTPEAAKRNLEADGFVDVESKAYVHDVAFSVEDVVSALPAILSMIQNTLWTQEQRAQYDAPVRQAIEALLVEKYGAEGMIPWSWEAVVATGRKPS